MFPLRRARSGRDWRRLAWVLAAMALLGCRQAPREIPAARQPPIVLITVNGLRADAVEALGGDLVGLTPALDAFLDRADLAVRGIAPSSATVPAAASLFTGLAPWRHGARDAASAALAPALVTLPQALAAAGYHTVAFHSSFWLRPELGYGRGFDEFEEPWQQRTALHRLESLQPDEPTFVWIDLDEPTVPYRFHPALLPKLDRLGDRVERQGLPERVRSVDVEQYFDPQRPMPETVRRTWLALYCMNVARLDQRLGELLAAIDRSPAGAATLVAVVSLRGEEIGDYQQAGQGGSLRRRLIEVPLGLRLAVPRFGPPLQRPDGPVATVRLFATLVEAAGGRGLPATAPSLFQPTTVPGVVSELPLADGGRQISWVRAGSDGAAEQVLVTLPGAEAPSALDPGPMGAWAWRDGEPPLSESRARELAGELERAGRLLGAFDDDRGPKPHLARTASARHRSPATSPPTPTG